MSLDTVAKILEEYFANARAGGAVIGTNTADEAAFLGISAGHLSRVRNERVPLTDDIIDKIALAFAGEDANVYRTLQERLTRVKMAAHARSKLASHEMQVLAADVPAPAARHSIKNLDDLLIRISKRKSLLAIDYRDLPQAGAQDRHSRYLALTAEAVMAGLSFALFQPFGPIETLWEKKQLIEAEIFARKAMAKRRAESLEDACSYLIRLATRVRQFHDGVCKVIEKEKIENDRKCLGDLVLYEAVRRAHDLSETVPSLAACGIQSRLFYVDYSDDDRDYTEVYEWVVAYPDEDYFIRRDLVSINLAAVRTQFSPILNYWEKYKRLPFGSELEKAYEKYTDPFFKKEDVSEIRWRSWSKDLSV